MIHSKTESIQTFHFEKIILVLIILLATILRLWDIDRTSLFHDEGISFYQSNRGFLDMLRETAKDNYPPLHNLLLWVIIKFVGTSETILRLPSALLGVAAVYAIYKVSEIYGPRGSGLIAAGILALLPVHIWHSVEVRMYAVLTFSSICYIWATLVHFHRPTQLTTILSAVTAWALLMSHVYGSFAFASIFAYVLVTSIVTGSISAASNRNWLLSQIVAAILFLPWIVVLLLRTSSMHSSGFWIPVPTAEFIYNHLLELFGPSLLIALAVLAIIGIYKVLLPGGRMLQDLSKTDIRWDTGLLLAWLVGPFILAYILSITVLPILYNRYLLVSAPAGLILIGYGIMRLQIVWWAKLCMAVLIVGLQLPKAMNYAFSHQGERHDFRSAAQYMMSKFREDDVFIPVEFYFAESIPYYTGELSNVMPAVSSDGHITPSEQTKRVWFLFSWGGLKKKSVITDMYVAAGFSEVVEKQYHGTSLILMEKRSSSKPVRRKD